MKFSFILLALLTITVGSKAQSSEVDSIIIQHIVNKCNLTDSTTKKLKDHFRKYWNAVRLCKITDTDYGKYVKERDHKLFTIFGEKVYSEYLLIRKKMRQIIRNNYHQN